MKKFAIAASLFVALALTSVARAERIQADLTGFQEVPVVSTAASGRFRGEIANDEQSISYELTYSNLQGTVTQGHIHVAQLSVNGSIVLWLCQTAAKPSPTPGTPECPDGSGTVTGTLTAADVIAGSTASQQLNAGDLAAVIRAIRNGAAYANVHTDPLSTGGEIRGQIKGSRKKN
jgi:CHRD domain